MYFVVNLLFTIVAVVACSMRLAYRLLVITVVSFNIVFVVDTIIFFVCSITRS